MKSPATSGNPSLETYIWPEAVEHHDRIPLEEVDMRSAAQVSGLALIDTFGGFGRRFYALQKKL